MTPSQGQHTGIASAEENKPTDAPYLRAQLIRAIGEFRTALTAEAIRKPQYAAPAKAAFALLDEFTAARTAANKAKAKEAVGVDLADAGADADA